jgi:2-methylcitrate synthase
MHTSLILYAEHEFNAPARSPPRDRRHRQRHAFGCITGAIGALRGPSTAAPTKWPSTCRSATHAGRGRGRHPRAHVERKEVVIGFGHPVYTVAIRATRSSRTSKRELSAEAGRHEDVRHQPSAWRR